MGQSKREDPTPMKQPRLEAEVAIASLKLAAYNPRVMPEAEMAKLKAGITRFGFVDPVVVNSKNRTVVGGHQRLRAAQELGMEAVPVAWVKLTLAEEKALNLALNKISGDWDMEKLQDMLQGLSDADFDMDLTGFGSDEVEDILGLSDGDGGGDPRYAGSGTPMTDTYLVPPFSVLDGRQGYWRERKQAWLKLGIDSGQGRAPDLIKGLLQLNKAMGIDLPGTSIFDPVLAELAVRWFSPFGGSVLDPFAGGSVRGVVSALLGRQYTGVDIRPEQVAANDEQWALVGQAGGAWIEGITPAPPKWVVGDSRDALDALSEQFDLVFSCPPYADLERYSDDPSDLSNMPLPEFIAAYRTIIAKAAARMKEHSFFVFVVGEVRNKRGATSTSLAKPLPRALTLASPTTTKLFSSPHLARWRFVRARPSPPHASSGRATRTCWSS